MPLLARASVIALIILGSACTSADLYSLSGNGPNAPDRMAYEGMVCIPPATGDTFPVKVVYAFQGGEGVPRDYVGLIVDALNNVPARVGVQYEVIAFHLIATGLQGSFVNGAGLQNAAVRYSSYQETGPLSLRAPLKLAHAFLSGDMQAGCRGTIARTRYVVNVFFLTPDQSCSNPVFNPDIAPECNRLLPDQQACSVCELTRLSSNLKSLGATFGAGQVDVQPIYVRDIANPMAAAQADAIALGGGTTTVATNPSNIKSAINALNYTSLLKSLVLKRVVAFNRSVISRGGQALIDSDGDGVPDQDEIALGLDPTNWDTDGDGLGDGVELRMGLDPKVPNVITGCSPLLDTDGDRLNDCEERVLGTNPCASDTDGDGVGDLVEFLSSTNPLVPEDLLDSDRDGLLNIEELQAHTDALSADIAYHSERGYLYRVNDAPPTADGRPCYNIRVDNITLVPTLARPNPPFGTIPKGINDVYLYLQFGRDNDPRGGGISALRVDQIKFTPPGKKEPSGTIRVKPEDFVVGN